MFDKPRRILSFDGGGIRGILTAAMLEAVEDRLKAINPDKELREYFDIIAGTSSGSIIACGVACGISAKDIKALYKRHALDIFPEFLETIKSIIIRHLNQTVDFSTFNILNMWDIDNEKIKKFLSQPIYDGTGLEYSLKEIFGRQYFGELKSNVIITSYDVYNHQAVIFKSNKPEFQTLPIWEVCRASSAVPAAFPAHVIKNEEFIDHLEAKAKAKAKNGDESLKVPPDGIPLIDGGIVASNPALCAIAECRKQHKKLPDVVASFGSGAGLHRITVRQAQGWGALNWMSLIRSIPLMDVFFDGSSDAVDYIVEQLFDDPNNYVRFQPIFKENVVTFSADAKNIALLEDVAERYMDTDEYKQKLEIIVNCLISEKSTNLISSLFA